MSHPPSILLSCSTEPALINLTSRPKEVPGRDRRGVDYMVDYSNVSIMPFHAHSGERDAFCIGLLLAWRWRFDGFKKPDVQHLHLNEDLLPRCLGA